MKLRILYKLFLTGLFLTLYNTTYCQNSVLEKKISLHIEYKNYIDVLEIIKDQLKVDFCYNSKIFNPAYLFSIKARDVDVKKILDLICLSDHIEYKEVNRQIVFFSILGYKQLKDNPDETKPNVRLIKTFTDKNLIVELSQVENKNNTLVDINIDINKNTSIKPDRLKESDKQEENNKMIKLADNQVNKNTKTTLKNDLNNSKNNDIKNLNSSSNENKANANVLTSKVKSENDTASLSLLQTKSGTIIEGRTVDSISITSLVLKTSKIPAVRRKDTLANSKKIFISDKMLLHFPIKPKIAIGLFYSNYTNPKSSVNKQDMGVGVWNFNNEKFSLYDFSVGTNITLSHNNLQLTTGLGYTNTRGSIRFVRNDTIFTKTDTAYFNEYCGMMNNGYISIPLNFSYLVKINKKFNFCADIGMIVDFKVHSAKGNVNSIIVADKSISILKPSQEVNLYYNIGLGFYYKRNPKYSFNLGVSLKSKFKELKGENRFKNRNNNYICGTIGIKYLL